MKRFWPALLAAVFIVACLSGAHAVSVSDFSDVSPGDWYYNVVMTVIDKGLFNGTSTTAFSPDITMTRGMFVTVLGRYGGASSEYTDENTGVISKDDVNVRSGPSVTGTTILGCVSNGTRFTVAEEVSDTDDPSYTWYRVTYNGSDAYVRSDMMELGEEAAFSDVPSDMYYAPYVQWACSNDIAEAENGMFRPDDPITREDMCEMICNYASLKHLQLEPYDTSESFTDTSAISSDCADSVDVLHRLGVINGYTDGSFRPKGSATRAEVSAILVRFIDAVSYIPVVESSYDQSGNYVFGTETPESAAVSADYFSDACFIGHSIAVGMENYLGLDNADFYAVSGASCRYLLNIYNGFELSGTHTDSNGDTVQNTGTLSQALQENSYNKVYIMLGTNDVAAGDSYLSSFYSNLTSVVELVKEKEPNATIYLFAITPVTQACSESRAGLNRDNIIDYNAVIKKICAEKSCYYLNVFDLLVNSDGFLPDDAAMSDGIHILAPQYAKIKTYIMTHTAQ